MWRNKWMEFFLKSANRKRNFKEVATSFDNTYATLNSGIIFCCSLAIENEDDGCLRDQFMST